MKGLDERHHRQQYVFDKEARKYLAQEDLVPNACLSAELSDYLIEVAEDERDIDYSNHLVLIVGFTSMLTLPSILTCIGYAAIELGDPAKGLDQGLIFSWILADLFIAVGLAHIVLNALQQEITLKTILIFSAAFTLPHILVSVLLGVAWEFPAPLTYVWSVLVATSVATMSLLCLVFGKNFSQHRDVLWPMCLASLTPLCFLFLYVFFRAAFVASGKFQIFLSPLYFGLKVGFKNGVRRLCYKAGNNPDVSPFLLFCVDAVAAFCGCLLFLDAANVLFVMAMISFDVFENFFNSVKIGNLVKKARSIHSERDQRKRKDEIRRLEDIITRHEERIFNLEERLDDLDSNDDFKKPTELPFKSKNAGGLKQSEMLEGHETVLLYQAISVSLSYSASNFAQIFSSVSACLCVPLLYHSNNRSSFDGIDELDSDHFNTRLGYLGARLFVEVVCFGVTITYLHNSTGLHVVKVALSYLHRQNFLHSVLAVACLVPFAATAIIIKQNGCHLIV
ncbi:hypothetical protein TrVE_jg2043 [Triparma verrucosa]|uniref:Transmembrane protein n=1 Tax=Triparma verrucosa TaxID=1606542 RepID=A0A9W7EXP4_9STRA|nr:hypothetical protein TrVE_jg2043 [Triparma verrucosa]